MAAAGSSDFQVERESNRVFVKPVKSGVSTDLFVWTASRRFAYELETTEEVKKMNFAIDNASPEIPRPVPTLDADQLADMNLAAVALDAIEVLTTVPRESIQVNARKGWLHLEGIVNHQQQRTILEDVTRHLPGVRGVVDSITVASAFR